MPPVVAVLVTHDPGPWLEESLASLAEQDYPNLSVLVLDAASEVDPTPRVAAILPTAYVRRLEVNDGFGPSANDVLNVVEGASHFVFLHDDVALAADAVRLLVEEAYRSNAGVVSPKYVAWDDSRLLLGVGAACDKSGHVSPYGRGELDQEQHDAVRDVFVAPGGCQLVRADLFATLQGFDPRIQMLGDDLDLCWRAQIAGARVVVAPAAVVRHLEATASGQRDVTVPDGAGAGVNDEERLAQFALRHRIRALLVGYGRVQAVRVLPQAFLFMIIEAVATRDLTVRRALDAWWWNLRMLGDVRSSRKRLRSIRLVRDREIRRLQTRGGARVLGIIRGGVAAEERTLGVGAAGRDFAGAVTRGGVRLTIGVWLALAVVLIGGSRHLLGGRIPSVGQVVPIADSWESLRLFAGGWTPSGLGSPAAPPVAHLLLGVGGLLAFGSEQLLQKVLVVGMLPIGVIGMHRLTAPLGSWRARLAGAVLYAAVPLPYDALSRGRWAALVSYAVMPWLMARLLRASGIAPFGAPAEVEPQRRRRRRTGPRTPADAVEALLGAEAGTLDQVDTEELRVAAIAVAGRPDDNDDFELEVAPPPATVRHPGTFVEQLAPAALLLGVSAAIAPPVTLAVLLAVAGLLAGFALVGPFRSGTRSAALGAAAVGVAAVLLLPWTFEVLMPGAPWSGVAGIGVAPADAPGLGEILALHLGHLPLAPLGWGLLVAAILPLAVGRHWRVEWATRFWAVAVVVWIVAWLAGRGWLIVDPPAVDVLMAPAAVAIVLAAVLGLSAFETDLPGYHFGWRQLASIGAAVAAVVATLPVLAAATDGRWRMPSRDFAGLISWMPEQVEQGDFRVLWIGAPDALPLDGWRLADGLAYGASRNGAPDTRSLWPGTDAGPTGLLSDALGVARRGETTRVGALLGPLGVRYIAVPRSAAPGGPRGAGHAPPVGLLDALRGQVDLRLIQADDDLVLFENAAWRPIRSVGAAPVLDPGSSILRSSGPVVAGDVIIAEGHSGRWHLDVEGRRAPHTKALDWANGFTVDADGQGTLRYRTPPLRIVLLVVEAALWAAAIRAAALAVRRRRAALRPEVVA